MFLRTLNTIKVGISPEKVQEIVENPCLISIDDLLNELQNHCIPSSSLQRLLETGNFTFSNWFEGQS